MSFKSSLSLPSQDKAFNSRLDFIFQVMIIMIIVMIIIILAALTNRRKRSIPEPQVEPHTIHGGERAFLYQVDNEDEEDSNDDDGDEEEDANEDDNG